MRGGAEVSLRADGSLVPERSRARSTGVPTAPACDVRHPRRKRYHFRAATSPVALQEWKIDRCVLIPTISGLSISAGWAGGR